MSALMLVLFAVIALSFVLERVVLARAPQWFRPLSFPLGKPVSIPLSEASKQHLLSAVDERTVGYRSSPTMRVDWSSFDRTELEWTLLHDGVYARFFPERGLVAIIPSSTWGRNKGLWVMFHDLRIEGGTLVIAQSFYLGDFLWLILIAAIALVFRPRLVVAPLALAAVLALFRGPITYWQLRELPASVVGRIGAFMDRLPGK